MQFLKTLFWALLAVVVVVFALGNWTSVPIHLWAGLIAEINLPLLLIVTFLAGLFPTLLYHHAVKWRLRHRLAAAERAVADLRGMASATAVPPPIVIEDSAAVAVIPSPTPPSEA
ncbi:MULTISPECIES: lipopolysaccharide assembly protein LapA domain-containing protein [Sphingomonas]|uniref:lipopolysaccharide assembly protein LapA domain-containing protein n=1 Tax=Sphingomonas TaxID=13687 RepID=UPI00082CDEFD|nr:lipopolysaccharide assembly protein LapA domain-containing protein [Sphingomonas sp. CCH10-B3]